MFFLLLLISNISLLFAQDTNNALKKLQSTKQLCDLGLINKKEFDSIANELKDIILNSEVIESKKIDGFYINDIRLVPEKFSENKTNVLGAALTYGLAGGGTKSILMGATSNNKMGM